jgi:hypothetical protein
MRLLTAIERELRERFEYVKMHQLASGKTIASISDPGIGKHNAPVYWLGDEPDGHVVLREVAYHLLCTAPAGHEGFPIVVVHLFSQELCRYLAYEGRFLMANQPSHDWLVISLNGEFDGWIDQRQITSLPTPQEKKKTALPEETIFDQ